MNTTSNESTWRSSASTLMVWLTAILATGWLCTPSGAQTYTFTTLAGNAGVGSSDGLPYAARFNAPLGVAVDNQGHIYVADQGNNTIRKVTSAGVVTTLAGLAGSTGSADGTGSVAQFNAPNSIAVDSAGNVYVADRYNHTIRKVTPAGVVTTFAGLAGSLGSADGTGSAARFNYPSGVAVDTAGNVYVADTGNCTLRKVTSEGVVTTLAGLAGVSAYTDGTGSAARFTYLTNVAVDDAGNIYVAEGTVSTIRKVTPAGVVTTLAGQYNVVGSTDGVGSAALFNYPHGLAVDSHTNIYVADWRNCTIRKMTPGGVVTTFAGTALLAGSTDGVGSAARFDYPWGVAVDSAGNVFVTDESNNTIRKITPNATVSTLAGRAGGPGSQDGAGSLSRFNGPNSVAVDAGGNVYVADETANTVRKITSAGVVTTLAGLAGNPGSADGTRSVARFNRPEGVCVDASTNVYVADQNNHTIRKITPAGVVSTFAGLAGTPGSADGTGTAARFNQPSSVAVDSSTNVYVTDYGNNTIRKITPARVVSTLAGSPGATGSADGLGSAARFYEPYGVTVDSTGNLYVADAGNDTVRKISPGGQVTTVAGAATLIGSADGTGSAARFNTPNTVAVDSFNNVFVADAANHMIRKITPGRVVAAIGGVAGTTGYSDGTGTNAMFYWPYGVAVDSAGTLYVADWGNNVIRKGFPGNSLPRALLEALTVNGDRVGFGLSGAAGLMVDIEASTDLAQWNLISSCLLDAGTNYFVSPTPVQESKFFRGHSR